LGKLNEIIVPIKSATKTDSSSLIAVDH